MSTYYNEKNKKIRGWKRRIRQLDKWGEYIKIPYFDGFKTRGYTYDRYTVSPFYKVDKRHPPMWFYKLMIDKFIIAYGEWDKAFKEAGVAYDLLIKLYDPSFIRSEIICYEVDEPGVRKRFVWESDTKKPFPYQKFSDPAYDLTPFEWTLADEENIIFQEEIDYDGLDVNEFLGDGYVKKIQGENEIYYAQRFGDIWMGRLKKRIS